MGDERNINPARGNICGDQCIDFARFKGLKRAGALVLVFIAVNSDGRNADFGEAFDDAVCAVFRAGKDK